MAPEHDERCRYSSEPIRPLCHVPPKRKILWFRHNAIDTAETVEEVRAVVKSCKTKKQIKFDCRRQKRFKVTKVTSVAGKRRWLRLLFPTR